MTALLLASPEAISAAINLVAFSCESAALPMPGIEQSGRLAAFPGGRGVVPFGLAPYEQETLFDGFPRRLPLKSI